MCSTWDRRPLQIWADRWIPGDQWSSKKAGAISAMSCLISRSHSTVERCYRPETTSPPSHTDKWAFWPASTQPTLTICALLLPMCSRRYVQLVISTPRRTEVTPQISKFIAEADLTFVVLVFIPINGSWCWWTPGPSSSSQHTLSIH